MTININSEMTQIRLIWDKYAIMPRDFSQTRYDVMIFLDIILIL